MCDLGDGERGRFVRIGVVDRDIEGLVGYLPEEGASRLPLVKLEGPIKES